MLAKRIIACLDVRDGSVVKGVNFEGLRYAGEPAALAARYDEEGIDELVILDVTATIEERRALASTIREVSSRLFIPLTVGGGIRTEADAAMAMESGADKVSINSAALTDPSLISRLAARYGSQAVVVAVDAREENGAFAVHARSGRARTGRDAVEWARCFHGGEHPGDCLWRRRQLPAFCRSSHNGPGGCRTGCVDLSLLGARCRRSQATPPQSWHSHAALKGIASADPLYRPSERSHRPARPG
jgi:hypothetical protein